MRRALRDALLVTALGIALLAVLELGARGLGYGDASTRVPLPPKAPRTFRILVLGGSSALGVPDFGSGFASQLARELPRLAGGRPVEVVNLARAGGTAQLARRRLARAVRAQPDLAIVLTGHNELLWRRSRWQRALQRVREDSAILELLERGAARLGLAPGPGDVFPERLEPLDRASAPFRDAVADFPDTLDAIVRTARARHLPLILCTAPSNLRDWPPVHARIAWARPDPDYDAHVSELEALVTRDPRAAAARARALIDRFGDDAAYLFLEARGLAALERWDEAAPLFHRAKELDPYPLRALDAFNDAVRARAGPGVRVVDLVREFAARSPHGLPGFELVADNVHPSPMGQAVIAHAIAEAMRDEGWLLAPGAEIGSPESWLARLERAWGDAEGQRHQKLRWLVSTALYAMKAPFFHFEIARRRLREARELAPGDWVVWANLATLSLLEGDTRHGRRQLRRATALRGKALDPANRGATPYLMEALARSGTTLPRAPAGAGGSRSRPRSVPADSAP